MNFSKNLLFIVVINVLLSLGAASDINFSTFEEKRDNPFFEFSGKSSIDIGALQLTPDTENDNYRYINNSGRILYYKPFKLWSSDAVASFNSSFVMNIFTKPGWISGEGLAFLIAPNTTIPDASHGQWLGLTNASTDGNPANQLVAIEFDTKKQDFDIDENHIGLNINSIRSKTNVSLTGHGIDLSPVNGSDHTVWIEYDGKGKRIKVYMAKLGSPKPGKPIINESLNLMDYVKAESYIGFAGSTGDPDIQLNCIKQWSIKVEDLTKNNLKWVMIGVGVGIGAVVVLLAVGCAVFYHMKRRNSDEKLNVLKLLPGMPREFRYKDLKKATKNFDESMKLGQGGFGIVYKGILYGNDHKVSEIAVKKFSRDSIKGKGDFLDELTIIYRLQHKHLVQLVGWCYEQGKILLVYEYMPNGSLDKHLYEASNQKALSWENRFKILTGVGSALHYLQHDYNQKVVHRDLKASNILLDADFNARLGDFGLARALENERNSYTELGVGVVQGTMGYVAPECFHTGKATPESDVFGFGAVILEVVCGKSPGNNIEQNHDNYTLVDWVWMLHREGRILEAVDQHLDKNYDADEAKRLLLLGLSCSNPTASNRPQTQIILQIMSGTLPPLHVPPFKPVFMWPAVSSFTMDNILSDITLSSQASSSAWSVRATHVLSV